MKTRILALTGILVLAAAFPAVAGTNKFSAKLKNTEGTTVGKVSFKVKTNKKGVATKVTSLKVSDVQTQCLSEDGVKPGPKVTAKFPGSHKITVAEGAADTKFISFRTKTLKKSGFYVVVSGNFKTKKGRAVKDGRVNVSNIDKSAGSCSVTGDFKAKRK